MCGPVHFVLHGGEELAGYFGVRGVVDAGGVDVQNLLVEAPFRGADVADALQLLLEIILLAGTGRVLEPFVVHGEALEQIFAQAFGRPLAELGAAMTADAVAHRKNNGKIVVENLAADLAGPLLSNY